ncbi:hypothetical protein F1880_008483, partial [Penicillium rolfsii]
CLGVSSCQLSCRPRGHSTILDLNPGYPRPTVGFVLESLKRKQLGYIKNTCFLSRCSPVTALCLNCKGIVNFLFARLSTVLNYAIGPIVCNYKSAGLLYKLYFNVVLRLLTARLDDFSFLKKFYNLTLGNPLLSRLGIQPSSYIFKIYINAINARKQNPAKRNNIMQKWLDTRAKYPNRIEETEVFSTAVRTLSASGDTISDELNIAKARGQLSPTIKETYRFYIAVGLGLLRVALPSGITIAGRFFIEGKKSRDTNAFLIHNTSFLSSFGGRGTTYVPGETSPNLKYLSLPLHYSGILTSSKQTLSKSGYSITTSSVCYTNSLAKFDAG